MRSPGERGDLVEKRADLGDNPTAPNRVIACASLAAIGGGDNVGAVEGVI